MISVLSVAVLVAAAQAQDTGSAVLRGAVLSEPSGLPVSSAIVEATGDHTVVAVADSLGRYALRVRAGWQVVRIRHLEHAPQQMRVFATPGEEITLDVSLQHRPLVLTPVEVRGLSTDSVAAPVAQVASLLGHKTLGDAGGLDASLIQGHESQGPEPGAEGETSPYVRESSGMLQLVLLDRAPVYAPFHTGGLADAFAPGILASARLHLGAAPARFNGGLSHLMDLSTRSGRGDSHSAAGALDMISAHAYVEGPLTGSARYLVSGRTVHGALIPSMDDGSLPYTFSDGLVRVDVPTGPGTLSLTAFSNAEGVRIDTVGDRSGFAHWGNVAGSLRWRGRVHDTDVEMMVGGGHFGVRLPVRAHTRPLALEWEQEQQRLGLFLGRDLPGIRLSYGASLDRTRFVHRAPAVTERRAAAGGRSSGSALAGFVDASWQALPELLLRGGLRAEAFSAAGRPTFAPRVSATWLVSDRAALTLGAGRYYQYVRMPADAQAGDPLPGRSAAIPAVFAVASATRLAAGLDQEIVAGTRLAIEGFYKRFSGLPAGDASVSHNSGADLWVRRAAGHVTGWIGYSLSWAWNTRDGAAAANEFLGRQVLSAGLSGAVWSHTHVAVRMAYGDGLGYTAVGVQEQVLAGGSPAVLHTPDPLPPIDGSPVHEPATEFVRLDAEVYHTWSRTLGTRRVQISPYLRVLNELKRRDPLFYRYIGHGQAGARLGAGGNLPFVPALGVKWQF